MRMPQTSCRTIHPDMRDLRKASAVGVTGCLRHGAAGTGALLTAFAAPSCAWAHGFGERYDLPLPLWLYLTGAAAAVALSFVVMALFAGRAPGVRGYPAVALDRWALGRALGHPAVGTVLRIVAAAVFALILVAGFFGVQDAFKNIVPTVVWVIWWVGFAYLAALVGNAWAVLNPLDSLYGWAEAGLRRLRAGHGTPASRTLPLWLGVWPAVLLFGGFAWVELAWEGSDRPANVAAAALIYAGVTWLGMWWFGRRAWLDTGEVFAVYFAVLGRFAPFACRGNPGTPVLRPYTVGLLVDRPVHPSMQAFVLLMLTTVTYDGFIETPVWAAIVNWALAESPFLPLFIWLDSQGVNLHPILSSVGLVVFFLLFLATYRLFVWLMALAGGESATKAQVAGAFVLTLVPIAIAYHLAHYLSYLLTVGQYIIPLASDPLGLGWDLFGTRNYFISIAIVDARFVWITSVAAIVIGHIVAVYLAHIMALRLFPDARRALRSQYPMLVLMLAYTMTSLWILSQPIVE